jgi:hypothetical protein
MCGRIAHEWPTYSPSQVAKLPFSYFRALRALYLRAHYVPPRNPNDEFGDRDMKVIDMDKALGIRSKRG